MPTRNVVVTEHQARMIESLVESGRYQNASEVLRDGLRLIEARDTAMTAKIAAFREAVQIGIDDIEAGRYETFSDVDALDAHLTEIADRAIGRPHRR